MCVKGDLIKVRLREWLHRQLLNGYYRIKGMGVFIWIPVFVLYVLIPVTNYGVYQHFRDMDMLYSNIITVCQYFVPLCSV